jgi:uroporphyrinogen-III synthase
VVSAPAIRIVPLEDDRELLAATLSCVERRPDIVVATTGIGYRGWMEAADGWGLGDALRDVLGQARLLARGPKARGAIRVSGLREEWSPESEAMDEVIAHLLAGEVRGKRIAIQLHGEPLTEAIATLEEHGAEVVPVPVYRWVPPADERPLARLVDQLVGGQVDAVAFTSAPAVTSLLRCAEEKGARAAVVDALGSRVLAACVGPVCARPLDREGVPTVQPERGRLGNLVRAIAESLPARQRTVVLGRRSVELRARGIVLDGTFVEIPPVPLAVLRALAERPGHVLSRRELLAAIPGGGDNEHVVEMAVSRLRALTGEPRLVETVVQRGYRACA